MSQTYQQQLQDKIERITRQFQEFNAPTLEVFDSPEQNFRMRAEFRIWHTENDLFYAMFERADEGKINLWYVLIRFQLLIKALMHSCLFYWQSSRRMLCYHNVFLKSIFGDTEW